MDEVEMFKSLEVSNGTDRLRIEVDGLVQPDDPAASDWYSVRFLVHAHTVDTWTYGHLFGAEARAFHEELRQLDRTLTGTATLRSREGYVELVVTALDGGHLDVRVSLGSPKRPDLRLSYAIGGLDQSYLAGVLDQLADS